MTEILANTAVVIILQYRSLKINRQYTLILYNAIFNYISVRLERKRKSDKISDKDLEAILDVYSQHETCQDKLIFDIAIELKTYRDLEKQGVLVKADWAKGRGAE